MTLNEAIRRGCRKHPMQNYEVYVKGETACVLGAAFVGSDTWRQMLCREKELLAEQFPLLLESYPCPLKCATTTYTHDLYPENDFYGTLLHTMSHLNDDHRWTREAIAEFVDPYPELHLPMPKLLPALREAPQ